MSQHVEIGSKMVRNGSYLGPFWEGIETGMPHIPGDEEIESMVENIVFGCEPLTPLNTQQRSDVALVVKERWRSFFHSEGYRCLCNPLVFYNSGDDVPETLIRKVGNRGESFAIDTSNAHGITSKPKMTVEEKRRLLTDPRQFRETTLYKYNPDLDRLESVLTRQFGTRLFFRDSPEHFDTYGLTREEFDFLLWEVKTRTGSEDILLCDIGGADGMAAGQIKQHDSLIHVTNFTLTENPAIEPVDEIRIGAAEWFPAAWYERFDAVVSNMAWRYFVHPHIALLNAIKSLKIGGWAHLDYNIDSNPKVHFLVDWEDLIQRTWKMHSFLKQLQDQGIIKFRLAQSINEVPVGQLSIIKRAPISKDIALDF